MMTGVAEVRSWSLASIQPLCVAVEVSWTTSSRTFFKEDRTTSRASSVDQVVAQVMEVSDVLA